MNHRSLGERTMCVLSIALVAGASLSLQPQAHGCSAIENPLYAKIALRVDANDPWGSGDLAVLPGTTVYFKALRNDGTDATTTDLDAVAGVQKFDTANYNWDWNYQTSEGTGATGGNLGLTPFKAYNNPGDRVVRLYV